MAKQKRLKKGDLYRYEVIDEDIGKVVEKFRLKSSATRFVEYKKKNIGRFVNLKIRRI